MAASIARAAAISFRSSLLRPAPGRPGPSLLSRSSISFVSTPCRSYATAPRRRSSSKSKAAPPTLDPKVKRLFLVVLAGVVAGSFILRRTSAEPVAMMEDPTTKPALPNPHFAHNAVSVIFVLGGPGAGKGTQCASLVRDYGFVHLSAGDLLRAEQARPGSQYGDLIRQYIRDGAIVPLEVTLALLKNAMIASIASTKKSKFLIDGFPRQMDQAIAFEKEVSESAFTLFFECSEECMKKRLLKRGETSGREDDNEESIVKRFRTFKETSFPVVKYYDEQGKVVKIDADRDVDEVYAEVKRSMAEKLRPKAETAKGEKVEVPVAGKAGNRASCTIA